MDSFVPQSLLKDVSSVSKRRMSFVPHKKNTGFTKGNRKVVGSSLKELSFLYEPPLVEKDEEQVTEKEPVDPKSVLKELPKDLDYGDMKLVSVKKVSLEIDK
jgi:hypothetical protein